MHSKLDKCISRTCTFIGSAAMLCVVNPLAGFPENLVPSAPGTAPNYYCTWATQNYMEGQGISNFNCSSIEGGNGNSLAQGWIRDTTVFGPRGWSTLFHPKARADLYFLFDDGEFAAGSDNSFVIDTVKFPSYKGLTPPQQWKKANDSLKAHGWRSLALWCRGPNNTPLPLNWCKAAGVDYWKIDGGDDNLEQEALRASYYPALKFEHMPSYSGPLNGNWTGDGRFGTQTWGTTGTVGLMRKVDIVRTYDVTPALSVATTIDRAAQLLSPVGGHTEVTSILNVEDEAYVSAGLGCLMGIMRQPMSGKRSPDCDLFFSGSRQVKKRMDEVARAARWDRIGVPFAVGLYAVTLDTAALTDSWTFSTGETWFSSAIGNTCYQGAPARVARGLPLPTVTKSTTNKDSLPFVLACRFANGAVSIVTTGRTKPNNNWYFPRAEVALNVGTQTGPFGVFGYYQSLRLDFSQPLGSVAVKAQDLIGDTSVDITNRVTISGASLTISGSVISEIGLSAATAGDLSDPGMVLAIQPATSEIRRTLKQGKGLADGNSFFKILGNRFFIPQSLRGLPLSIAFYDLSGKKIATRNISGDAGSVVIEKSRGVKVYIARVNILDQ